MENKAALRDLAPTGTLRVAVMYTNPVLAAGSPATGDLRGIAVDVARALGEDTGLPLQIVPFETRAALLAGDWDVCFGSPDPHRREIITTAPLIDTEGTYLVPGGSALQAIGDVDRAGVRIAVSAKSALDLHLTRSLQRATLERIPGAHAAAVLLIEGKADALAGLRQQLMRVAAKLPGSRVLDGRFMVISQALAMRSGNDQALACLDTFVAHIKASGRLAQIIQKNGIKGVLVSLSDA